MKLFIMHPKILIWKICSQKSAILLDAICLAEVEQTAQAQILATSSVLNCQSHRGQAIVLGCTGP